MISNKYIICEISGGLADQIRGIVLAYSIINNYKREVKLDITWFDKIGTDSLGEKNRTLEVFNIFPDINIPIASNEEIEQSKNDMYLGVDDVNSINNINQILQEDRYIYLSWFNIQIGSSYNILEYNKVHNMFTIVPYNEVINVENSIKNGTIDNIYNKLEYSYLLNLDNYIFSKLDNENLQIYDNAVNNDSIAIHIRRSDYPFHIKLLGLKNTANIEYYKKVYYLLSEIIKSKKTKVYIFSDDYDYVYNNIVPLFDKTFQCYVVSSNKNYIDFYLLSKFKYIVSSLGRFATLAYFFNQRNDKLYIDRYNINNLIFENINQTIFEKYSNYICGLIFPHVNKIYIDQYSMSHILNLIDINNFKNIFQVGIYSGIESKTILNYIINFNKDASLECFDINNRSSICSELLFGSQPDMISKIILHFNKDISEIPNVIQNKEIDMLIFTYEKSYILSILYIIYLFPYIKENSIMILNDLNKDYSFGNFLYNKWIYNKNIFYSDANNNVGYIIINKQYLLKLILEISTFSLIDKDIIFFRKQMLYIDYNDIDIEFANERVSKLKNYMESNFDKKYINKLLFNLNNNIHNYFYDIENKKKLNEFNKLHNELFKAHNNLHNEHNNLINRVDELNQLYNNLFNTHNNLINKIAWWIPIRKWRDNFRNKFSL